MKIAPRTLAALLGAAVLLLVLPAATPAQDTFEDRAGRFMIDLPDSYTPKPQQNSILYQFAGDGGQIIMVYLEGADDAQAAFEQGVDTMRGSLENAKLQDDALAMQVNGNPARWGAYKGSVTSGNREVTLYAYVGSVVLDGGSVYFLTFLNDNTKPTWESRLREAFDSIRDVGDPVMGAANERPVQS